MSTYLYPPQVYGFLAYIERNEAGKVSSLPRKILDCGAGGPRPPLALFAEQGFSTAGLEIDPDRAEMARAAALEKGLELDIRVGDMRALPFEDEAFSYVYEYYSICHLPRADMPQAIHEMMRVLRPGGLCYLGFMGKKSWPLFGRETGKGEVIFEEGGREVLHSVYDAGEPEKYFSDWEVVQKESSITHSLERWRKMTLKEWNDLFRPDKLAMSAKEWQSAYSYRLNKINYSHEFYIVRK